MPIPLDRDTIKTSIIETLSPKFEARALVAWWDYELLRKAFEDNVTILTGYIYQNYSEVNIWDIEYIQWLHRLLYPENSTIIVQRGGIRYANTPGEWRKHEYNPQIPTSYWSKQCDIEEDLYRFTHEYNRIDNKTLTDIVRYYFDFLRVHPFSDSNMTVATIICDLECRKYWFDPLHMLKIRFMDKQFLYYIITYHEENIQKSAILEEIIGLIYDFHDQNLSQHILDAKNKQVLYSTAHLQ